MFSREGEVGIFPEARRSSQNARNFLDFGGVDGIVAGS